MSVKAYKGFDKNLRCLGFQYEVGKEYETGRAELCEAGFHACENPLNVLRFYPLRNGNRYCEVEQDGEVSKGDDKTAATKIKIGAEIGLPGLIKAYFEYTRTKAASGQKGGDDSNLAGGDGSNLAGGDGSNLAGGYGSNLAGGDDSNLAGGDGSNLAGGDGSNLAGGYDSNLAGGDDSNLAGGYRSNLVGGYGSNLAGGYRSNLAGGDDSNLAGGYGSNLAGGYRSNLAGGYDSNLAGGYDSNLAGGDGSNLAGGDGSNLAGGYGSNLAGGDGSNLAGGDDSNLAGGKSPLCVVRNGKAKGGLNSVLVLTEWEWRDGDCVPTAAKPIIIDGAQYKPDTWYCLEDGEVVEWEGEA